MDIFKQAAIAVTGALICVLLKKYSPALAACAAVAVGCVIFFGAARELSEVMAGFERISENIDMRYFALTAKVIGVAYITQFAAEICRDSGENALAVKLEMSGKILILAMTLPLLSGFLKICTDILSLF